MINGIINIYKEQGFTSFDVVAKLRGMLKIKKIGHTGTLDPDAVGVLPVCLGNATGVCDILTDKSKEYVALMMLGIKTDTQDTSGEILKDNRKLAGTIDKTAVIECIRSFEGDIMQVPPMYSALKVNGRKLVDLARQGVEVERKPRQAHIDSIEVLDEAPYELSLIRGRNGGIFADETMKGDLHNICYVIRVRCSKGTYIRTLCEDIGEKLGCGACMAALVRTSSGIFGIEDAYRLDDIQRMIDDNDIDSLHNAITTVDIIFNEYPALHVTLEGNKALINGNQLQLGSILECTEKNIMLTARKVYRIYNYVNQFYGLYEYHSGWNVLKPVKLFIPKEQS